MTTITRRQGLAALAGVAATAAFGARPAGAAATELRIGWQKSSVVALLRGSGALEKLLAPRGITVSWSEFSSGPPLLEALGAGALDFGHTGDVPPLFALAARGDLVFAGTYKGGLDSSAILVPKDSPVASIADLKGKRVAFRRGSSAHNFIVKALRTAGLTPDDVIPLDLAPPDAAVAFAAGDLGAWAIWDPFFALAEREPTTRVLATTEGIVDSFSFFLANGSFAKENGPLLAELIDVLRAEGKAAQADLDSTVATFSAATGLPPEVTRVTLTRKNYDLGNVAFVSEEAIVYEQALADEFHALGILPRAVDIRAAVWRPAAS